MNNKKYESPEIQVISLEPDKSIMTEDGGGMGIGTPSIGTEYGQLQN